MLPTTNASATHAQAMILAAGRGQRMRPLTDHTPKPLLQVRGRALMAWHLEALAQAGIGHAVVNTGWLGAQIPACFGSSYRSAEPGTTAVQLHYSREDLDFGGGIETAGGIARALPLLDEVFWLVAGDVHAPQFVFEHQARQAFVESAALAHLWLVRNPAHHPRGDFTLQDGWAGLPTGAPQATTYTYSTIALLRRTLFAPPFCILPAGNPQGIAAPLGPLLLQAAAAGQVSASLYEGEWTDVGTPERLQALNRPANLAC